MEAQRHGLKVKLHADQLSNRRWRGVGSASHGAVSADHLEHTDEAGVIAMAEAGTVAVLLPGAFYFLRETKLPPIELLRNTMCRLRLRRTAIPAPRRSPPFCCA